MPRHELPRRTKRRLAVAGVAAVAIIGTTVTVGIMGIASARDNAAAPTQCLPAAPPASSEVPAPPPASSAPEEPAPPAESSAPTEPAERPARTTPRRTAARRATAGRAAASAGRARRAAARGPGHHGHRDQPRERRRDRPRGRPAHREPGRGRLAARRAGSRGPRRVGPAEVRQRGLLRQRRPVRDRLREHPQRPRVQPGRPGRPRRLASARSPRCAARTRTSTTTRTTSSSRRACATAPQHTHDYVGNESADANSTNENLGQADTTCRRGDLSTYYWPIIRVRAAAGEQDVVDQENPHNIGTELLPARAQLVFRGNAAGRVVAMPQFIRVHHRRRQGRHQGPGEREREVDVQRVHQPGHHEVPALPAWQQRRADPGLPELLGRPEHRQRQPPRPHQVPGRRRDGAPRARRPCRHCRCG